MTVLVAGGAGAVGNAAIQLASWSGATVVTTVSSPEKAALATDAGADSVVNYRDNDAAEVIRSVAPGGVDIVVEVAPAANAQLDGKVLAPGGVIAMYSWDADPTIPFAPGLRRQRPLAGRPRLHGARGGERSRGVVAARSGRIRRHPSGCGCGRPAASFPTRRDGRGA